MAGARTAWKGVGLAGKRTGREVAGHTDFAEVRGMARLCPRHRGGLGGVLREVCP